MVSAGAASRKYFYALLRSVLWRKIGLFLSRTDRAILSGCPDRAPFIAKTVAITRIWVSCPTIFTSSSSPGPVSAGHRSMMLRRGPSPTTGKGRSIPMEKLDNLVAGHIEDRLLQPERLEEVLAAVLDRRHERAERRHEHIAELNKRAAETDLRLKRLYDAIESGVADLDDPALKDRIASLKATRDQAQADAERAQAMAESAGQQTITPQMVRKFDKTARERMRIEGGGYRREHLRALAQRVEVADGEVRIMGSKGDLLRTVAAGSGVKSATPGVRSSVLSWRMGCLRFWTEQQ
jgi:hypothetical protein